MIDRIEDLSLDLFGVTADDAADLALDWLGHAAARLVSIAIIVIATIIALRLLRSLVQRIIRQVIESREGTSREAAQRASTLASIVESTGRFVILFTAGITILANVGISLAPVLASAGIAGIAIAFGAQKLVADAFNGFFILLEGQYAVGDFIRVGSLSGSVEELSLRRTVIRSAEGAAVTIPNSEVRTVENLSKGWSRAIVDIAVAPEADEERVMAIIHDVLHEAQQDPDLAGKILEEPNVLGLNTVEANRLIFRALVKTLPMEQWATTRELQRRIRARLIEQGVPLPPRTIDIVAPGA